MDIVYYLQYAMVVFPITVRKGSLRNVTFIIDVFKAHGLWKIKQYNTISGIQ